MKNILPVTLGTDSEMIIEALEKRGKYHALRPDEYGMGLDGLYWANINPAKIHKEHGFELLLIPDDTRPWIRRMVMWCKKNKIPVLVSMGEGLVSDYNSGGWGIDEFLSDHVAVAGQKQKNVS